MALPLSGQAEAEWRTFVVPTYGFQFQLPATGPIAGNEWPYPSGECGHGIRQNSSYDTEVLIDNFLGVWVLAWDGSIREFIAVAEPHAEAVDRLYTLQPVLGANADEAMVLVRREGEEWTVKEGEWPYAPLAYTLGLFKRGNQLLYLHAFQNPGNFGGCVPDGNQEQRERVVASFAFVP